MSENTHTPEVGQVWAIKDGGFVNYYKITKLTRAMVWYHEINNWGEPTLRSETRRIWTKNIATMLGEPLEIYEARKEAEREQKALS
jgi:hypothetical protein